MSKIPDISKSFLYTKLGKAITNPAAIGAAYGFATASNLTKDGVNCAYYVAQSLNNERIPDDKRNFVAGIDLANGILNVSLQAGVSAFITDKSAKFFDNHFAKKHYSEPIIKKQYEALKNKAVTYEEFFNNRMVKKEACRTGFGLIVMLVAMQVLTKRIITPLLSTPMADGFKVLFDKSQEKLAEKNSDERKEVEIATA